MSVLENANVKMIIGIEIQLVRIRIHIKMMLYGITKTEQLYVNRTRI